MLALARDVSEVSCAPLAHSPLLGDADLVDCLGYGDAKAQTAVARRAGLSHAVAAALAEIGERAAVLALIGNRRRRTGQKRAVAGVRAFLGRSRRARTARRAAAAAGGAARRGGRGDDARIFPGSPPNRSGAPTGSRATAASRRSSPSPPTVRPRNAPNSCAWLRGAGHLTIGLLLRALACGDVALFSAALADMAQLPPARVAGWLRDPASFAALYGRAKLPPHLAPAFRIAVVCALEAGGAPGVGVNHELTLKILRAVEAHASTALEPVVALLWRLAAEGARADARDFVETAAFEPAFEEAALELAAPPVLMLNVEAGNENFAPPVELELPEPVADAAAA